VLEADSIAHALVQRAFDADAQLANPDSLYIPDAEIIVNGAPRADAPRFAGVAAGGSVQLGSSRFAVTGNYVWGTIQYRWVPGEAGKRMIDGWATLVIARIKDGSWRIVHAHSSTAPENP
jgi:ketosteroid isomerase-like protein